MKNNNLITKITTLAAAVAMTVGANNAFAANGLTADSTIFNQVKVSYTAIGSNISQNAYADVAVKIQLNEVPPTIAHVNTTVSDVTNTATLEYTITSNANGNDQLLVTLSTTTEADTNVVEDNIYRTNFDGTNLTLIDPSLAVDLAGGISLGVTGNVISFPGGSLHGFESGDYIVQGSTVFQVTGTVVGSAASYDYDKDENVDEVLSEVTVTRVSGDGTLSAPLGTLIRETLFVTAVVTASNTDNDGDDTDDGVNVGIVVTDTDDDDDDGDVTEANTGDTSQTPDFKPSFLTVEKYVSVDGGATYYDTDELDADLTIKAGYQSTVFYKLVIPAASRANVDDVILTDELPDYTTLNSVNKIMVKFGSDAAVPLTEISGDAEATNISGELNDGTITIRLGSLANSSDLITKGGTLTGTDTVEVVYSVDIQ